MSEQHPFISPPGFVPEYHIGRVSSAIRTFLDDMNFIPTNINPVNKNLENSMEELMYARGLECEQLKRTLHLAAALIELGCHKCTLEEKTNAALFTCTQFIGIIRFGVYMDDRIIKDPIPFREFGARILRNQQQLDPVLAAYTEVLNHMWDLYDPMVASTIFNNTLNFVTGCCIEPEIQKVSIVQGVDRFGWYIRDLTGVGIAFALFPYTKTGSFDILSVIQAIPDMNFWLSTANDLLSFHKEESAGETGTHIYIRAITSNQSRYDTCDELVAELKKTRETIYAALSGNQAALETWKVWERGFVEWHLIQKRYRLRDLGVATNIRPISCSNIEMAFPRDSSSYNSPHFDLVSGFREPSKYCGMTVKKIAFVGLDSTNVLNSRSHDIGYCDSDVAASFPHLLEKMADYNESIGIIGAGPAGLITAHTLVRDGYRHVQILTRDANPGGVWARERVYPGLIINNVHGEFRFSSLPMPAPVNSDKTGGRLTGPDMCNYLESFTGAFLKGLVRYKTEVLKIKRDFPTGWLVEVENMDTGEGETLKYSKIVLCTGGCSTPFVPESLSPSAAQAVGFNGPVFHSSQIKKQLNNLQKHFESSSNQDDYSVVVVGGGKSSQDMATYLTGLGRKVTVVFDRCDGALAVTSPLPDFIRKSRFLGVLSPHIELRTRLERFLHQTWLGSKITHFIWNAITSSSMDALRIPKNSPLRNQHSFFWGIRTNDEGVMRPDGFFGLVNEGKITLEAPAHVEKFGEDGRSVILNNGKVLKADTLILATGYTSSWRALFDEDTASSIGITRTPPSPESVKYKWKYTTLANPPQAHPHCEQWSLSIYRGIVPCKNITQKDFAVNGSIFTTNNGYIFEVVSHWISSYFQNDKMNLPETVDEAVAHTERNAAWLRQRYPDMLLWANDSYSSNLAFWTWPQMVDELLEDMGLKGQRSGGSWFNWPFKVLDLKEIADLKAERDAIRENSEGN